MALNLSVPDLSARAAGEELQPEKVRQWLDGLPLLNVADTGRKLFSALSLLNRVEFDDPSRLQLLELYRAPVRQISLECLKQYIGLPLPLAEKHTAIAEQNRQFQMELAHGYKRIVLNAMQAGQALAPNGERVNLAVVIQRAIRHLTGVLAVAYETYSPYPPGVWLEIHTLYRRAEELGLAQTEVEDPLNQAVTRSSVNHAYQQALLLDVCDPYHLPARMIDKIHHYLDRFAPLAHLTSAVTAYQPVCQFLIDRESDRAGVVYTGGATPERSERYRLLNTVELARRVHTQLTLLQNGETPPAEGLRENFFREAGQDLLRRLVQSWGVNPKRSFRRNERRGYQVEIAIGLDAMNYWLNGGRKFVVSSNFVGPLPLHGQFSANEFGANEIKHAETKIAPVELSAWNVEDESAGGLALSKSDDIRMRVRVADLLILRAPGEGNSWEIGVIRWVKSASSSHIEIGVQRLAPGAEPVVIKAVTANGQESDFLPALLLPEIKPLKQAQTLITHRSAFKPKDRVYMDNGCRLYTLRPTKLVESSSSFEQFQFDILNA